MRKFDNNFKFSIKFVAAGVIIIFLKQFDIEQNLTDGAECENHRLSLCYYSWEHKIKSINKH